MRPMTKQLNQLKNFTTPSQKKPNVHRLYSMSKFRKKQVSKLDYLYG